MTYSQVWFNYFNKIIKKIINYLKKYYTKKNTDITKNTNIKTKTFKKYKTKIYPPF